jgi:hypothetical protein
VVHELVARAAGHLPLQALDLLVGELHHPPRLQAHHVVVVLATVEFEDRVATGEVVTDHETSLLELRQHAVDRGESHILARLGQAPVQVFGTQVARGSLLQRFEDAQPGRRRLEARLLEIVRLHRAGFRYDAARLSPSTRTPASQPSLDVAPCRCPP